MWTQNTSSMPAPTTVQPVSHARASMRLVATEEVVQGKVHSSQVVMTLMPRLTHLSTMGSMSASRLNSSTTAMSGTLSSNTRSASSEILTPSLMGSPAKSPTSMPTTSGLMSMAPTTCAPCSCR